MKSVTVPILVLLWLVTLGIPIAAAAERDLPRPGPNVHLRGSFENARIQFERQKQGHVAFIGGSITEMNGYRPMVCDILKRRFPQTRFTFTDAGVSSTCSTTGAFRLRTDVLDKGPVDKGPVDKGPVDKGPVDKGPVDKGPVDKGPVDKGPVDKGPVDKGPVDKGPVDKGPVDKGPVDKGPVDKGPVDLFFVEFAVNDDQDAGHPRRECTAAWRGSCGSACAYNPCMDIIITHFVNPEMLATLRGGETPRTISAHETVAAHYGISTVNLAKEVADRISAGTLTWERFGGTHPAPYGNAICAAMIDELLARAWSLPLPAGAKKKPHLVPVPLDR